MPNSRRMSQSLLVGMILLLLAAFVFPGRAIGSSDPVSDVWSEKMNVKGTFGFVSYIDIREVSVQGSSILIDCVGDLPALDDGRDISFLVLFNDDGDPHTWEAAMLLSLRTVEMSQLLWHVGSLSIDDQGWDMGRAGTHYSIENNQIFLTFVEFAGTGYSEIIVMSKATPVLTNETRDDGDFYDWFPDSYDYTWGFRLFTSKIPTIPTTTSSLTSGSSGTSTATETTRPALFGTGVQLLAAVLAVPAMIVIQRARKR